MLHQRADVFGDGHFVVVEDNHQGQLHLADDVQRFERHAARNAGVTNKRHNFFVGAANGARLGKTQRNRQRIGCVTCGVNVVLAFCRVRETRNATKTAQRGESLQAPRKQLVRVGLMTNVEHEFVGWRVDQRVNSHNNFNGAQR